MRLPRKFSQSARKTFLILHLWTGLGLGLWLILMGLTGSVLAWRSEFTSWEVRTRVGAPKPGPNDKIIPVSQAIAALKKADPELNPERGIYLPPGEYAYYLLNARGEVNGKRASVTYLVNPVTGKVYPPVDRSTLWIGTIEELHGNLLAEARGAVANGAFSFFAVLLLFSGAWLWWPSNIKQLKQRLAIKRGVSLRRTLYDVHNALGVYMFGLLMLLSLTAVALVLNEQTSRGITRGIDRIAGVKEEPRGARRGRGGQGRGEERGNANQGGPNQGGRGATNQGATNRGGAQGGNRGGGSETVSGGMMPDVDVRGEPLPLDTLVEKARAAVPNGTLVFISQPRRPGQPFQTAFDPIMFNNGLVLFDPYTGERLEATGSTFTPGQKTMKVVGDLHYGWFGGVWSKFFYALSGLLPLGLSITGTWMWLNKKRSQKKLQAKRAQKAAAPKPEAETVSA